MGRRLVEGEERERFEAKVWHDHNAGNSPSYAQDGSYYEWTAEQSPIDVTSDARIEPSSLPKLWHVTPDHA